MGGRVAVDRARLCWKRGGQRTLLGGDEVTRAVAAAPAGGLRDAVGRSELRGPDDPGGSHQHCDAEAQQGERNGLARRVGSLALAGGDHCGHRAFGCLGRGLGSPHRYAAGAGLGGGTDTRRAPPPSAANSSPAPADTALQVSHSSSAVQDGPEILASLHAHLVGHPLDRRRAAARHLRRLALVQARQRLVRNASLQRQRQQLAVPRMDAIEVLAELLRSDHERPHQAW